jgi:O-6-methylguanine DNA methyltransferase
LRDHGGEPVAGDLPAVRCAQAYGTAFQLKVWQAVSLIPSGQTQTYGQLAKSIGCGSARAVGVALGANPLAGLIPCHRVVAADGLGGFAWGVDLKRAWLRAETDGAAR